METIYQTYSDIRPHLNDGDIAFFSSHSQIGDFIIKHWQTVVNRTTDIKKGSIYSHVGTIMLMGNRVFLLEASFAGGVRMIPLSLRQPDMVVSMGLTWNQNAENFAMDKLGMKYGLIEAVRAGMGLRESNNSTFICTEYVAGITEQLGYSLPKVKQLPSNFYTQLENDNKTFNFLLHPEKTLI